MNKFVMAGLLCFFASAFTAVGTVLLLPKDARTASTIIESRKEKLPRDEVYYDITNDAGDQGNFAFSFHYPDPDHPGKKILCIVYKDHSKQGVSGGESCDFGGR